MGATFLGVRHHSPACARLVRDTILDQRPAHVLVEGPADVNDRLGELLLGHELPIALYTYHRGDGGAHASWTPFCDYSPEWVALTAGREVGARVRFIDLPAWHPAFADRDNRYADAEIRYAEAVERLCREFAVDNVDTLWDHLFEAAPEDGLAERLTAYFDLLRGDSAASPDDRAREEYMARWVRAALARDDGPVLVVTGGFHTPALRALVADGVRGWTRPADQAGGGRATTGTTDRDRTAGGGEPAGSEPSAGRAHSGEVGGSADGWPEVPRSTGGASYLVPYSHRRLDAFTGYESGMPSPEYYHWLWHRGVGAAADELVRSVVTRLRGRKVVVSTADLIAARTLADGLARLRGHDRPARVDVLDGLTGALVSEDLDRPPPWARRGPLEPGTHPAIVEMVAALSGDRVGRLHADTPAPPLVAAVQAELLAAGLDGAGLVGLDLADPVDLDRSRLLHRLRVLGVPGFARETGPRGGGDPEPRERWLLRPDDHRVPALIEAAAHGATASDAAGAKLAARLPGADVAELSAVLFDAALCGVGAERVLALLADEVGRVGDLVALGRVLADVLSLWRHDRLLGTAGSPALGAVVDAAVTRLLWLAEGVHGGPAPAEPGRLRAIVAVRDAVRHAGPVVTTGVPEAVAVLSRVSADRRVPPDLRGAAFGFGWSLGCPVDAAGAVRGMAAPATMGDWLAGLFALARDEVLTAGGVVGVLDEVVDALTEDEFLVALPALRQAFAFFPPAEREAIARMLLELRGVTGSARALLRTPVDPVLVAEAGAVEAAVDRVLAREGLA
ncbi:DUF5682 family protein [Saccharothrix obliqua]|uniref:DUF5682 family protein n=1 Tax=Saccharothrix obliqua TaxID=2861747 RepID=UPI001C600E21|nr:DUF5682 family protein [Saccharothrix obliqua]